MSKNYISMERLHEIEAMLESMTIIDQEDYEEYIELGYEAEMLRGFFGVI